MLYDLTATTAFSHSEQDRQSTYNLTLKRVRVTIVTVEKSISITYSECVSFSLSYAVEPKQSACAVLYCHLWSV